MKKKTKRIVLAGGCFDILHYGHIHFLKHARALGDHLVVALESDKNIKRLKGSERPIHDQEKRREILESLNFVDEVIILKDVMNDHDYFDLVDRVRPCTIAVTVGDPMIGKKKSHASKVGAKIVEVSKIDAPTTTQIAKLLELETN